MKNILFLTGTRADFGKLKPLMKSVESHPDFSCSIFITGMHTLNLYGYTANEVFKEGFKNIYTCMNQHAGDLMEMTLASTIKGLSRYVHEFKPNLIIIHGDRVEALAGAIVGALTNTLVCHIEGGERSGTIDESIRHSVTKLSHIHMVANEEAAQRLIQMGEVRNSIFNIGSPDIDIMMSKNLPSLAEAKERYDITFHNYGIVLFHSVTTDLDNIKEYSNNLIDALIETKKNYIVIYPNNDEGSKEILSSYSRLSNHPNFKIFPSLRFEYFLTLLKHTKCIVGNSSAGIREAPCYGVPTINIGNRQESRHFAKSILHCDYQKNTIIDSIKTAYAIKKFDPEHYFGQGDSASKFIDILDNKKIWNISKQKSFNDISILSPLS